MMYQTSLATALVTALLCAPEPTFADITTDEAWEELRALAVASGQSVDVGSTIGGGQKLTLQNVVFSQELETGPVSAVFDEIVFEDAGDGSVIYTLSDGQMTFTQSAPDTEKVEAKIGIEFGDFRGTFEGEPGNVRTTYVASAMDMALISVLVDDEPQNTHAKVTMTGLTGEQSISRLAGAAPTSEGSAELERIAFNLAAQPEEGEPLDAFGAINGIKITSSGTPMGLQSGNLPEGFESSSQITFGESLMNMAIDTDGSLIVMNAASGFTETEVSDGQLSTFSGVTGLEIGVSGKNIPLPEINFSLASASSSMSLPLQREEEAQPFSFGFSLTDIAVGDNVWQMIDAGAALPRDPANLNLQVSGTGKLNASLMSPNELTGAGVPGELKSLNVDQFRLGLMGAELIAKGDFEVFTPTEEELPAIPQAEGELDVDAAGINTLLGQLTQAGILPPQFGGMAQMFIGMFAVPGEGPDTLQSKIEIMRDGSIFANGQQLR